MNMLLNRQVTIKRPVQSNQLKSPKLHYEDVDTKFKCRIQSNRSYNQFNQKDDLLGKIGTNKLVMFSRKAVPPNSLVIDNKTGETWCVEGNCSDMAGNGYLWFVEVKVHVE